MLQVKELKKVLEFQNHHLVVANLQCKLKSLQTNQQVPFQNGNSRVCNSDKQFAQLLNQLMTALVWVLAQRVPTILTQVWDIVTR